ncbi:MAG TPA: hypothetical protein PLI09_15460 [Candidatus Hydrogenedentes bacterium]|nr:hypothetical protein [Candidatus Hydrogenedentota bacterium]
MKSTVTRLSRPSEAIVGVVFLAGAFLKAMNFTTFTIQIFAYGVITDKSLLPTIGYCTLTLEMLLGCSMLFGIRWRWITYAVLEALLLVFTSLILYGWMFSNLRDCGCFGPLEMSPGISIGKNAVLMVLGGLAWLGGSAKETSGSYVYALIVSTLALTGSVVFLAHSTLEKIPTTESGQNKPVFAQFVFDLPEGHFDLGKGDYLVVMLSMSCEECMGEVPELNTMLEYPDLPPLVALCYEENMGDLDTFRSMSGPQFPMYSMGNRPLLYFNLIDKDTFRLYFVRNGQPVKFWDGHPPEYEELRGWIGAPGG